jgi:hypothetical protein
MKTCKANLIRPVSFNYIAFEPAVSLPAATAILLHRCGTIAGEGELSGFLFGREVDQGVDGVVENSSARDDVDT